MEQTAEYSVNINNEQTGQLPHNLARGRPPTTIELEPETLVLKAAQKLLEQEVDVFKQHGALLNPDKLALIHSQREFLTLDDAAAELLRLSQATCRRAQRWRIASLAVVIWLKVGKITTPQATTMLREQPR